MALNCYDKSNAKGYLEPNWSRWPIFQEKKLNKTIKVIKENILNNGIEVSFHGKTLYFDCLKTEDLSTKCKFGKLGSPLTLGEHNSNTGEIILNESLRKKGSRAFSTIYHEYAHEIQRALIKHIGDYDKNSLEYQYLSLLKSEHEDRELKAFDIASTGAAYINEGTLTFLVKDLKNSYRLSNLAEAFYSLQVSERNAFSTGQDAYDYLMSLDKNKGIGEHDISRQKDAAKIIREEYGAQGLTYNDICTLVDNAKTNIVEQKAPNAKNDIEAAITYDMAAFIKLQTATDTTKDVLIKEYTKLMMPDIRKATLEKAYKAENRSFVDPCSRERIFNFEFINDIKMKDNFGAKDLAKLDAEQQKKNPHLIVSALFYDREEAIHAIKDEKAFKIWYYSDLSNLSNLMREEISSIMGKDYSVDVWKEKNKELNGLLKIVYPEYDASKNHDLENYEQEKFRFLQKKVKKWKPDKPEQKLEKETDINR